MARPIPCKHIAKWSDTSGKSHGDEVHGNAGGILQRGSIDVVAADVVAVWRRYSVGASAAADRAPYWEEDFSSAARSQFPRSAAASYVLWQKSSSASRGDAAARTSSYISKNSPICFS